MSYKDKIRSRKLQGTVKAAISHAQISLGMFDRPDPNRVWGVDTSHWTGVVDWQQAKERGCAFAIIKYMDGTFPTRFARENYRGAVDAGVLVGSYQWLRKASEVSPGRQAREYLAMLRDMPVNLPPAVDFEWSPAGKKFNVNTSDLYGFVIPFEDGYGSLSMVYTAIGYWSQYGSKDPFWAARYSWQARYGGNPLLMLPWLNTKIHQWTEKMDGEWMGIPPDGEKGADGNYWLGTLAELYAFCKLPPVTPTPSPEPPIELPPEPEPPDVPDVPNDFESEVLFGGRVVHTWKGAAHIVQFQTTDVDFLVTPPSAQVSVSRTSTFARVNKLDVAINGGGFTWQRKGRKWLVRLLGFAASRGRQYPGSAYVKEEQTLYISREGQITVGVRPGQVYNAISFPNMLVKDGAIVADPARKDVAPRTVLAWKGNTCWFYVHDGVEAQHTGLTLFETADLVLELGCENAVLMDGGGSTTLVIGGIVVNKPSDGNIAGNERAVANHIGMKVR